MSPELQKHLREKATVDRARAAMKELIDCTNIMGNDAQVVEGMTEALQQSHRTLQQSFMGCFVSTMGNYSKIRSDARNEGAVDFAKKITEMEIHFPFI